ncbi:2,3-bisphosphoglycerate-dependent phosphoglycerate mutase [Bacillus sp. OV322]|uniref:histidine phosphatase family protein n=1 Tax=Bacillus sp. OV322 TaxID=1882764 RepID=UPI0008E5D795|nr:histidine phosphatase family protein [Bacillus sp. OV322]SFC35833.1 2,3-bisphosphoglycerate-dependent phosphoglycerate mutase [Bacillus sp. OV322]
MLTNLYFVRHAHSEYSTEELKRPLSEKGLCDAKIVNQLLAKESIDYVISSPYLRAIQTVEGVAKCIEKEIIIEDAFKERQLSSQRVENFQLAITKVWKEPSFFWEGGESNVTAQKRGVKATLKVLERFEDKNILIGTHGNVMVLIMNYFDTKYGFDFWKELNMPDIYKLSFNKFELKEVNRIWGNG